MFQSFRAILRGTFMWIVRLALRRPYTFTVMALLIVILGLVTLARMAKDIFPSIDIPVVAVVWTSWILLKGPRL